MRETAPVWKFADVNPLTPEFKDTPEGTEVTFMPLEAVWPGERVDFSQRIPWSSKQSYTQFRRGDILVPKITPTFEAGRTVIAEIPTGLGLASTEVHIARVHPNADARYLQYCFQSAPFLDEGAHSLQGVGNLRRITPRFVQEHRVLDVSRHDQMRIADYLDRETGEIDAMLGKLDDLAETLQKRRIAAISTAIRQSEAHSCALGIIFSFHNGDRGANYPSREEMVSSGVPFINAGHLLNGSVSVENMNFITSDHFKRMGGAKLIPGDILFCLRGSVGKFGMFSSPYQTGALASSLVALRSRDSESDLRYLSFALGSDDFTAAVALSLTGSAQPNLSVDQLAQLQIPAPPPAEQKRIADHLDEVTGTIDVMLAKVAELKALLIERRAALITDVVTGRKEVA